MITKKNILDLPGMINKYEFSMKKKFGYAPDKEEYNDIVRFTYSDKKENLIFYSNGSRIIAFRYQRTFANSSILKRIFQSLEKKLLSDKFYYIKSDDKSKKMMVKRIRKMEITITSEEKLHVIKIYGY